MFEQEHLNRVVQTTAILLHPTTNTQRVAVKMETFPINCNALH